MLKSILLVSVFSCLLQTDLKTGNAYVQNQPVSISTLPADVQKKLTTEKLCLVLPEKNNLAIKNKSKYLKCYLVNHTGKAQRISRADGSLAGVTSQIHEKGQWVFYQQSHPIYCGNSYWSQTLEDGKALLMHYEYTPNEKTIVAFRLRLGMIGDSIYSNTIMLQK